MPRLAPSLMLGVTLATVTLAAPAAAKWPPWLSVESPVNPYDPTTRDAVLLVHAAFREGAPSLADLRGSAEGMVGGARRSVALRFDTTSRPGVFALRRQWPADGAWVLRLALRTTTAIVALDRAGRVATVRVPTESRSGMELLRAVTAREVDSTLAAIAAR